MTVNLDREQVDLLLSGLDAIIEAAEAENDATGDADIHESNDAKIAEAGALYGYLSENVKQRKAYFPFSKRRRLAKMFDAWADKNKVAKTPEGVIAFLQSESLLDLEAAQEYLEKKEREYWTEVDR